MLQRIADLQAVDSVPVEVEEAGVRRATRSDTFQNETLICDVLSEDSDLDEENQLGLFELLDSEDEDDPDPDQPVEPIQGDLRTIMGELDWKFEELKEDPMRMEVKIFLFHDDS